MKKLNRIKGSEVVRFKKLVEGKHNPAKDKLLLVLGDVNGRFAAYQKAANEGELGSMAETPASLAVLNNELKGCYLSSTKVLRDIKVKIRKAQETAIRGTCQFCGINENPTFDHYLPKDEFPEFSAMALNLFPMCGRCNQLKGEKWRELVEGNPTGARTILNLYTDQILDEQYLKCEVKIEEDVPTTTFTIRFTSNEDSAMQNLILAHYKQFDLLKRYQAKSDSPIGEIVVSKRKDQAEGITILKESLLETANAWRLRFGANYWKSALYNGLAESQAYLEWATKP